MPSSVPWISILLHVQLHAMNNKNGRPEKTNAVYFSHYTEWNFIVEYMFKKHKYEGYFAYYRLLEYITKSDYHKVLLKTSIQNEIFKQHMDCDQSVIDDLINVLLEYDEIDKEEWNNGSIWYPKVVKTFKSIWHKRGKKLPEKETPLADQIVSGTRKCKDRIGYDKIGKDKIRKDKRGENALSTSDYQKMFPDRDVIKALDKCYQYHKNPTHEKIVKWLENEKGRLPIQFKKSVDGGFIAYCSKCGSKQFPKDEYQKKSGSTCCHVEYVKDKPSIKKNKSNGIKSDINPSDVRMLIKGIGNHE